MPLAPVVIASIIGAAGATAGGALSNRSSQSTTPTLDPSMQPLQNTVLAMIQKRLGDGSLPAGYEANGLKGINAANAGADMNLNANLTARGLASSPIAGNALLRSSIARQGQIGTFESNLPLVQRQLQNEDLGLSGDILRGGRGFSTTREEGGGAAGAFTNLAQYMGYLSGKGAFKGGGGANGLPGQMAMPGAFGTSGAY